MYNIIDLIDKLIAIEKSGHELYLKISESKDIDERVKIMAKVFSDQEKRHMQVYEDLKKRVYPYKDIDIEFSIYDKAAKLIYEFSALQTRKSIHNIKDIMEFSLGFEKENLALVLSLRGLFVRSQQDMETKNYEILSEIIKEEQKHIQNIEPYVNRN